jgi:hypothetical protein
MANPYKTRAWKKIRSAQLETEPLCRRCLERGVTTAATDADHVIPWAGDLDRFYTGELQSLCRWCHAEKSSREDRDGKPRKGHDADGNPVADW